MKKLTDIEILMKGALNRVFQEEPIIEQDYLNINGIRFYPDFHLINHKILVYADGDYWHGLSCLYSKRKLTPSIYIKKNMLRDWRAHNILWSNGWVVLRFSGTDIKNHIEDIISIIKKNIFDKN